MRLLHWTTLQPQGSSSLAAIRFSAPVIIKILRVFGPNEPLFSNDTSIRSETEYPESHEELVVTMRLMFTAAPLASQDATEKPKPSNQLATTKINYEGGTRDFKIDVKAHSTRLMMLVTWLPKVTVAVYGDLVSDLAAEGGAVVLTRAIEATPTPLPQYLDFSRTQEPMALAKSLCVEAVGEVSTLHLLRLMFLLKPADTDWDIPNYPAKYAEIGAIPGLVIDPMEELDLIHPKQRWLEQAMEELRFPIHDEESVDTIKLLAEPMSTSLEVPSIIKPAWLIHVIANLSQHPPIVAEIALAQVDFLVLVEDDLATGGNLTEKMILCAANPSFANHLSGPAIMERLKELQPNDNSQHGTILSSLITRVEGWEKFEQSLETEDIPFAQITPWIYGILGDEESFAMFIQGLVAYGPISKMLKAVPTSGSVKPLFSQCPAHVGIADRRSFVRAIVGISSILPIFCWANSEGKHHCLQRVIHAFLIWQIDPGYSEILNRVLSLKQCIWRLFMTVKDYTQGTSLGAERLLYQLYRSNTELLFHPTFANYLSSRTDDWLPLSDDVWLAKAAITAQQGIKGVLKLLFIENTFANSLQDPNAVYLLRVLVEHLHREVFSGNEEAVFKAMWTSDPALGGIVPTLVGHLAQTAGCLHQERLFKSLSRHKQIMYSDLFAIAHYLLALASHFGQTLQPVSRVVDQLTTSLIQLRVTDKIVASLGLSDDTPLLSSAQKVDSTITQIVDHATNDKFGSSASSRLLETLLLSSQYPSGLDAISEFEAVTGILSELLPQRLQPKSAVNLIWGRRVVHQLALVQAFLQRIDGKQRAEWILRLVGIDNGESGLDYALLSEEITQLQLALDRLQEAESHQVLDYALQFQIATHFECLEEIVKCPGDDLMGHMVTGRLSEKLARCYAALSHLRIHDEASAALAKRLMRSNQKHLRVAGICTLFREGRLADERHLPDVLGILRNSGTFLPTDLELLVVEIGHTFSVMSSRSSLSPVDARAIVALLEWLASSSKNAFIPTLTYNSFQALQKLVQEATPDQSSNLTAMSTELHFGDDEQMDDSSSSIFTISKQALTPTQVALLIEAQGQPRTPPRLASHPALGLVTTSPPSINRPLMSSNLVKTYLNNDFRQLRGSGSSRHNTSRPPSIHVDDFVAAGSPLGTRSVNSVNSQASAQSSPAIPHAPFNSFIPGLQ